MVDFFVKRRILSPFEKDATGREDDDFILYAPDGRLYYLTPILVKAILSSPESIMDALKMSHASALCRYAEEGDLTWNLNGDFIYCVHNGESVLDRDVVLYHDDDGKITVLNSDVFKLLVNNRSDYYIPLEQWAELQGKSVAAAKRQCQLGRVSHAVKIAGVWFVPEFVDYPERTVSSEKTLNDIDADNVNSSDGIKIATSPVFDIYVEAVRRAVTYLSSRSMKLSDISDYDNEVDLRSMQSLIQTTYYVLRMLKDPVFCIRDANESLGSVLCDFADRFFSFYETNWGEDIWNKFDTTMFHAFHDGDSVKDYCNLRFMCCDVTEFFERSVFGLDVVSVDDYNE